MMRIIMKKSIASDGIGEICHVKLVMKKANILCQTKWIREIWFAIVQLEEAKEMEDDNIEIKKSKVYPIIDHQKAKWWKLVEN